MGKQKCTVWAQQAHCETKHWQNQCETPPPTLLAGSADKTQSSLLDLCARGAPGLFVPCLGALLGQSHREARGGQQGQMAVWMSHFTLKSLLHSPKFKSTVDERKTSQNLERDFW